MDMRLTDPLVGRLLEERYVVEAFIAHGGMATVYLATDNRLEQRVADKVLHPHLCDDTDTVAAIAGGLLGAAYGASAVPGRWRRLLHGWPGLRSRDLVALSTRIIKADADFDRPRGRATLVQNPYDDGVWLGDAAALLRAAIANATRALAPDDPAARALRDLLADITDDITTR